MAAPSALNARAVESVLESLRRGQRQLARDPRGAVEFAVKQLLSLGRGRPGGHPRHDPERRTYRVDELARLSGVTVRNIRAYQERGLLLPPERVGRVALFDDAHLSRLKIITSMLDRGYTAAHITEMLTAWEHGKDLADVLGLEKALVPARLANEPESMSLEEARTLAGGADDLDLLVEAGLVERKGARVRVLRPDLMRAFAEMREFGMSTAALVGLHQQVMASIDEITGALVDEGVRQLAPRFLVDTEPTSAEVRELVLMLTRFRALAITSVTATLSSSIEARVEDLLSAYLAHFLEQPATDVG